MAGRLLMNRNTATPASVSKAWCAGVATRGSCRQRSAQCQTRSRIDCHRVALLPVANEQLPCVAASMMASTGVHGEGSCTRCRRPPCQMRSSGCRRCSSGSGPRYSIWSPPPGSTDATMAPCG